MTWKNRTDIETVKAQQAVEEAVIHKTNTHIDTCLNEIKMKLTKYMYSYFEVFLDLPE